MDDHSTKFIQEEYYSGILGRAYINLLGKESMTRGFIAMNEALKARCESGI